MDDKEHSKDIEGLTRPPVSDDIQERCDSIQEEEPLLLYTSPNVASQDYAVDSSSQQKLRETGEGSISIASDFSTDEKTLLATSQPIQVPGLSPLALASRRASNEIDLRYNASQEFNIVQASVRTPSDADHEEIFLIEGDRVSNRSNQTAGFSETRSSVRSQSPVSGGRGIFKRKTTGRFAVSPTPQTAMGQYSSSVTELGSSVSVDNNLPSAAVSSFHSAPNMQRKVKLKLSVSRMNSRTSASPSTEDIPLVSSPNAFESEDKPTVMGAPPDFGTKLEYIHEVDEAQRTVQSLGGISIDTQDSARYDRAPFTCGNIQFVSETYGVMGVEPKRHYVVVPADTVPEQITSFMSTYWQMRSPKIVLSVISDIKHFKPWKNQKLRDDFQKGFIKAANTTEMWIVTNGLDGGVAKIIGDAIAEEKLTRLSSKLSYSLLQTVNTTKFQRLTVIGIVPKDVVAYGMYFDGSEGMKVKNEGSKPNSDSYELNPAHTHFIVLEEDGKESGMFTSHRCGIEKQFEIHLGRSKKRRLLSWEEPGLVGSDDQDAAVEIENVFNEAKETIPVVGMLVQGSPRCVEQVLYYLQNQMPVLILKGSGGLSDLIAFAYEELLERGDDLDFEDSFLKPELIKMISKFYPKEFQDNDFGKNEFRDKIIDCVHLANEGEQTFLTVVNMKGHDSNLRDLDKFILRALFKSEKRERSKWRERQQKDLHLTLDWNRSDIASDLFQKEDFQNRIRIDKNMFEQCLLKKDREAFVELFLDQGVRIHKFLNHRKLKYLFEKAEDREFFVCICLEEVLGQFVMPNQPLPASFLGNDLNRLIYKLCGVRDFIQPYEMSMTAAGLYVIDPAVAERKAINCLIVWAVLMNRPKLAKALWNRCDDPMPVALICSNMYKELAKFCMEMYLRTEVEKLAGEFGQMALGVLDICYRESSVLAFDVLSKRLPDFNSKTVIEIAHEAGYIHFIAHPCCQKWLTKEFFGSVQVKELDWGPFRLPYWFKILSSAFLIFPMYIWITFIPKPKVKGLAETGSDSDSDDSSSADSDEEVNLPTSKSAFEREMMKRNRKTVAQRILTLGIRKKKKLSLPLWKQIYFLWSAPITKFWTAQLFYFIFLGIFCLAVLWPTCGNLYFDLVIWFWTAVILTELVHRTYVKYHKYKTVSLIGHCVEIFLIMAFLCIYLFMRIIPHWVPYMDYTTSKSVLCFALIYFFYRLLGVYLPISPTLGPMLLRMNRMIRKDFVTFIRMFLIFMIVGGVTIQAVLYPNYPLGIDAIKRVLTRPLFAMFLTKIDDLDGDEKCSHLYNNVSQGFCADEKRLMGTNLGYTDPAIQPIQTCPYMSLSGYIIVIQYLLTCKLILVTLLFAMFSLSISKVDSEASEIWKFQRYALVADFKERFSLPPPFTLINYIILLIVFFYRKLKSCCRKCDSGCHCCNREGGSKNMKKDRKSSVKVTKIQKFRRSDDYNYWKKCAREYTTCQEEKKQQEELNTKQTEQKPVRKRRRGKPPPPPPPPKVVNLGPGLVNIQDDLRTQKKMNKRLNNRIVELERVIQTCRLYLEDISHKLDKSEVMGIANVKGYFIHVAARQSPYPTTTMARFPVFDKYVPWEVTYDVYDPKMYTLPKRLFPETDHQFVDEDIIELKKLQDERAPLSEAELEALPPIPQFNPVWNAVVIMKKDGKKREIDRRSWITDEGQPLRYALDPTGLPQNPMGRTGMRGKGILWRWGPNHVIKAVVTRWRLKHGKDLSSGPQEYLYVEGKRVLEFIAVKADDLLESTPGLPGDALHGLENPYSKLCRTFMNSVFNETTAGQFLPTEQSDMIQFFAQFATPNVPSGPAKTSVSLDVFSTTTTTMHPYMSGSRTSLRTDTDQQGFSACLLYKGYLDDPRNTDNAWVEAEVWNFHYESGDMFDARASEDSSIKWKEVSPYVKLSGNEGVIVQEAARIHDGYH
ncbi:hypothetical protein ACJMK2_032401 [Sinanodonta woodiana]|uniref:Uncharacterized protein n=1 Tax=Sinanodonta woodiana TaxID=1069815 RepID=A0ABD3X5I6_SINWO